MLVVVEEEVELEGIEGGVSEGVGGSNLEDNGIGMEEIGRYILYREGGSGVVSMVTLWC